MFKIDTTDMSPIFMSFIERGIITLDDFRKSELEDLMTNILNDIHKSKITKTKDGRYSTYIPDPSKPHGRRLVKKATRAEMKRFLIAFYNIKTDSKLITFADLYKEWVQYKKLYICASNRKRSMSPSTIRRYERDYNSYLKGTELDNKLIGDITTPKLETILSNIIRNNDMTERCAGNVIGYVVQAFSFARRNKYIEEDPAELIDRDLLLASSKFVPPKDDSERVLTKRELNALRESVLYQQKRHPEYMPNYAIELAMYTGMRVGELGALHWSDIDEDFIHINYSEHRLDYSDKPCEIVIGEPKNGKHRVIQMTAEIKSVLDKVKALNYTSNEDFVFVRKDGSRYTGHTIGCATERRSLEAGIKKTSIHEIRRTVSSLLNTVLPQKAVADMLGHSERVNELCYNYSMAENAEKKRALEDVFSNVFNISDYFPENKKAGNG